MKLVQSCAGNGEEFSKLQFCFFLTAKFQNTDAHWHARRLKRQAKRVIKDLGAAVKDIISNLLVFLFDGMPWHSTSFRCFCDVCFRKEFRDMRQQQIADAPAPGVAIPPPDEVECIV